MGQREGKVSRVSSISVSGQCWLIEVVECSYTDIGIIGQEFANAVLDVIGRTTDDEAAKAMKARCVEYAKLAMARGGRQRAATEIMQIAQDLATANSD
jgi:hypothetical protein